MGSSAEPPSPAPVEEHPAHPLYLFTKRALDIVVSACFLVAFSWLYLLIAILVKATSRGPAFYVQDRVGCGGRRFPFIKFRSMIVNADAILPDLRHHNEADGPVFKMKNDPRVTPVGRFLRKYSLDELPQMANVLVGQMSLVGPRPPLPSEVEQYGPREWRRLSVRPGITCLWQINGRSEISFSEWVDLDLEYIERRSFWLDVCILIKTIPAVISGRGAC
jgi:exopolysaccharide biosynthesis polyprenyl glycosylphosphotransferase